MSSYASTKARQGQGGDWMRTTITPRERERERERETERRRKRRKRGLVVSRGVD